MLQAQARDSAGVRIVEYPGSVSDLPIAFRIADEPALDLGGPRNPPDHELGPGEHQSSRLSDGRMVVTERSDLKVFDAQGRYVATLGRAGQGPGEFRAVDGVCVAPGDLIVALAGRRVSVFASNGAHVRTFAYPNIEFARDGCFEDGSLIGMTLARPDPENAAFRVTTARRVGLDGSDLGVIGTFPFGVGGVASLYVQMLPSLVPHGKQVYVGDGRRPEIQVYRTDGVLTRIIRWNEKQIPLTDQLYNRIVNAVRPGLSNDEVRNVVVRSRASGLPAVLPAYAQIRVDPRNRIWVQDYHLGRILGNFPPRWTVFDSTGSPLGRVVVPTIKGATSKKDIRSFGSDVAMITWKDTTFGFPHLSFHQITKLR